MRRPDAPLCLRHRSQSRQSPASRQPPVNAVDYAATGSVEPAAQREFVAPGPCGEQSDQR